MNVMISGVAAPMLFHPGFQDDWVNPEQIDDGTYLPLSLGAFSVDTILRKLEEWQILNRETSPAGGAR